ncbi:MAG: sensor histidine kinase [Flavobacteriales bacterium]|nr:sensor histidine kinase [Flavobacteriales bacterium]
MTPLPRIGPVLVMLLIGLPLVAQPPWEPWYDRYRAAWRDGDPAPLAALSRELEPLKETWAMAIRCLSESGHAFRNDRYALAIGKLEECDSAGVFTERVLQGARLRTRAVIFKQVGDQEQAEREIRAAIDELKLAGRSDDLADSYTVLSEVLRKRTDYSGALEALTTAERLADSLGYEAGLCNVLINRGNLCFEQQRYAEAWDHYQDVLARSTALGFGAVAGSAANNLGATAYMLGRQEEAIQLYDNMLRTLGPDRPGLRGQLLNNMGLAQARGMEHKAALASFNEAFRIAEANEDRAGRMTAMQMRSTSLWALRRQEEALRDLQESLVLAKELGRLDRQVQILRKLAGWLGEMGDHQGKAMAIEEYAAKNDTLNQRRFADRMAVLEVRHETEKKERLLNEQRMLVVKERVMRENRSLQRNLLVGTLLFVLVAGLMGYRNLRHRQRLALQEKELTEKRIEEVLRTQELRLLGAVAAGQEQERERIARELHDHLGSMLSAMKIQFSALEEVVAGLRIEQRQSYGRMMGLLDDAVGTVRRISHDMVRGKLAEFGLVDALGDLRDSIAVKGRLEVELIMFGLERRMDRRVEVAAYGVVQELVSNALRHGKPTELSISLTRAPAKLTIIVADNGAGFDPAKVRSEDDGMGLANVRSRAAALGGEVSIDSTPGRGTTVVVEFQLAR